MSCYPLFLCHDWSQLAADLSEVQGLVSATIVTDPFANINLVQLQNAFPDLMRAFKEHFVIDLRDPCPSSHHRKTARRALRDLTVKVADRPEDHLESWLRLYAQLCVRRNVTGIRAFSEESFRRQLRLPGCVLFYALLDDECVAISIWYTMGEIAYGHLIAADADGYRKSGHYALIQTALEWFSSKGLRWMLLGAAPGQDQGDQGIAWFKKGWGACTKQSYLCGRIFARSEYSRLSRARGCEETAYFPAYRSGEFA